jgi:tRNA (uracil-5-)-methyltransferase TRM9
MDKFEQDHVQQVYNEIAEHFSNTRYKAWPVVTRFLKNLAPNSIGIDCGCGNGKNMLVNRELFTFGMDNSIELAKLAAKSTQMPLLVGDVRKLPFLENIFDFALSIAVVHHLVQPEDRKISLAEMIRVLAPNGQFIIFVWAREQEAIYKTSGLEKLDHVGDFLVPWKTADKVYKRFYHLFEKGELEGLLPPDQVDIIESGYDRDNWYVIGKKKK